MKKLKLNKLKKWYVLVPLVIIVLVLGGYMARGWGRHTAAPDAADLIYGRQVQTVLNAQYNDLGQPFKALGFTSMQHSRSCNLTYAKHFKADFYCMSMYSVYTDKVGSLSPDLGVRAAKLDAVLQAKGWQNGYTSLTTLGQSIAKGIDWQPDADYTKTFGNITCDADFNTAFSKPKPAAISGRITCSRALKFLE